METLLTVATFEIAGFLGFLFLIVIAKMVTGDIALDGLFHDKTPGTRKPLSPARIQLLAITVAGASEYLLLVLRQYHTHELPDLPESMTTVFAGSQVVYLSSKAFPLLMAKLRQSVK